MTKTHHTKKSIISFGQLLWLMVAQLGGASIIYLPGMTKAGRDIWISNIIASIVGYLVIFSHHLPLSLRPGSSMTKLINKYWGKVLGGVIILYYFIFNFILSCLVLADVYYFGKITMPETPGYAFIVFLLIPAVYGIKLGLEVIVRLVEFLVPILACVCCILFLLAFPKLDFYKLLPIMGNGIKPVLAGAIPNMNFPYAQILPIVFYYHHTDVKGQRKNQFLSYAFLGIFLGSFLLTFRAAISAATFEEATLKTLTFPPFSTIRLIEIGEVIERLDPLFLGIFHTKTYFKFTLTYYVICEIISDYFETGEPRDFAWPVAILIGVSMPFLIPRFDIIISTIVPYFLVSLPLFLPIPLLLFITIKIRGRKGINRRIIH